MLTRRHIRVKVLQSLYAYYRSDDAQLETQEKYLLYSIAQMRDLHALLLSLLVAMRDHADKFLQKSQQKYLATDIEKNPSRSFLENKAIALLSKNRPLAQYLQNKKLINWDRDSEYVTLLFNDLRKHDWYSAYLELGDPSFEQDREFVLKMYKEVIAPNEKLYEFLEDNSLSWLDDFPLINTAVVKMLDKLSERNTASIFDAEVFKNEEDREYTIELLRKVIQNDAQLSEQIDEKTPNWDKERIADIDMIILKMGIVEFLYFPSIPVKVTINEYLEVSKEYSTPKSSLFINGILDKLVKELSNSEKLNKIGRGLR